MEISLDNMQVSFMTAGIKTASDSVSLTAAETEIKSRSEAMDKFQEEYRQLKAFVKDYRDTLNNDLASVRFSVTRKAYDFSTSSVPTKVSLARCNISITSPSASHPRRLA